MLRKVIGAILLVVLLGGVCWLVKSFSYHRQVTEQLNASIEHGDIDETVAMLRAGADPYRVNDNHETPLMIAIRRHDEPITHLLLSFTPPRSVRVDRDAPEVDMVEYAARHGDVTVYRQVVAFYRTFDLQQLLFAATESNNVAVVQCLIKQGADPNRAPSKGGRLPLLTARSPAMVRVLLASGADPAKCGADGSTPLHAARDPEIADLLLARGVGVNARNHRDETPLHTLLAWQLAPEDDPQYQIGTARTLIAHGADIHARDIHGNTPLHLAALPEIAEMLLKRHADVNARNAAGETPLHKAAARDNDTGLIADLLKHGADVNASDDNGRTPLHRVTASTGSPTVINLLLEGGADINACDNADKTPLDTLSSLRSAGMESAYIRINDWLRKRGAKSGKAM